MLTQERLKALLHYDPETGVFTWKVNHGNQYMNAGRVAGHIRAKGYIGIGVDGKSYAAHRLAWMYVHGELPTIGIDHINRKKNDNRLINLRLASQSENLQNQTICKRNTSGLQGVSWSKSAKKWHAYISFNKKRVNLGLYSNIEDAAEARRKAKSEHHNFHPIQP